MIYKKHFICNIDSLQYDNNPTVVTDLFDTVHTTLIKYPNHCVVLTVLWEANPIKYWQENFIKLINLIKQHCSTSKILLIINSWYQKQVNFIDKSSVDEIVFVDFFLLMTYYRLIVNNESAVALNWDPSNKKFLFLTGKPYKIHRIRLLHKFKQHNLLPYATWSLFLNNNNSRQRSRKFLKELSDDEYNLFLSTHSNNPDSITMETMLHKFGMTVPRGIPYQLELYKNSLFQVISETNFKKSTPWITEKTWLSIINRRPFLMASSKGTLKKLKKMGFKTFENYTKMHYDNIASSEKRLDAIVINTKYWIDNMHNYVDDIEKDVEYNYQRLLELAQTNLNKLLQLIDKYALECKIDEVIRLIDEMTYSASQAQWCNWYKRIKDDSWPDCPNEDDFVNLPDWIQQECINVFNYKTKN
jgi:hypothetical protein